MLVPVKLILKLERARRKLMSVDPDDNEKLLAMSKKVDKLIVEYYRAKSGSDAARS